MLNCYAVILRNDNQKREILVSPLLLQSKERPNFKAGKQIKLFFYEGWVDDEYKANFKKESLGEKFKMDGYLINYGQDFSKYYLGCIDADFETKEYRDWQGESDKITDEDVKMLGDALFNADAERRWITLFTPTRPSDFNLGFISAD